MPEPDYVSLVAAVAKRPAMYVGANCMFRVRAFLDGYLHACHELNQSPEWLSEWRDWIEWRFGISHPAWGWHRVILHAYGSHMDALAALPLLLAEYRDDLQKRGAEAIKEDHEARFHTGEPPLRYRTATPEASWTGPVTGEVDCSV